MPLTAREVLRAYVDAQASGTVDDVLALIADDAVFDVGRGRYEGSAAIRAFHERLTRLHSVTRLVSVDERGPNEVEAEFEQHDDDLRPLGIDAIRLTVTVQIGRDGRISRFTARPTAESLARIVAARDAGRSSEGLTAAERAGTLTGSGTMKAGLPAGYVIRSATVADVSVLCEQRIAMFTEMRTPVDAARIRSTFEPWLRERLPSGTYRAWLVDAPDGGAVAGAAISLMPWPPGPRSFTDRLPIVFNVYTAPAHRRRGLARALMETVHAWCRDAGYSAIGLAASADGLPLYESLGYERSPQPYLFKAL